MPRLEIIEKDDHLGWVQLTQKTSTIGRDPSCQIVVQDEQASRRHAEIVERDDGWWIKDLGSTNGTIVNDNTIDYVQIRHGDAIRIGNHRLVFHEKGAKEEKVELKDEAGHEAGSEDVTLDRAASGGEEQGGVTISVKSEGSSPDEKNYFAGKISEILSGVLKEKDLFQSLLDLAIKSTGADRACLILPESDDVVKVTGSRTVKDLPEDAPISDSIILHTMKTKEAVVFTSDAVDDRFSGKESVIAMGKRSVMAVPLISGGQVIGVIQVDADHKVKFSEDTLRQLLSLAGDLADAIAQNRVIRHHAHSQRLEGIDLVLRGIMRCMSDIMKSMKSGSRQIDAGLKGDSLDTVKNGWSKVQDARRRLSNLIRDVSEVVDDKPPILMGADLNTLVGNALDVVRNRASENGAELVFEEDASLEEIEIDPMGIYRAVKNILTNAIEATADAKDGKVAVKTAKTPDGANVQVIISDNGAGIGRDRLNDIFVLFNSSKRDACLGLGLPVAQKTVKEHGGGLDVNSTIGKGTTFTITLPMRKAESS